MFAKFKQVFNPKNRDLLKRILFTLAALFIFKIGTAIIVPGVNANTSGMAFLEVLDAMSGGAFANASIFALGVSPYITASIVIQLLCADIVPYLSGAPKYILLFDTAILFPPGASAVPNVPRTSQRFEVVNV